MNCQNSIYISVVINKENDYEPHIAELVFAKVNLKVKVPAGSENTNELCSGNKSPLKVKSEA